METLRGFVSEVWAQDPALFPPDRKQDERCDPKDILSKPDDLSGSMEMRRLSAGHRPADSQFPGPRVDFFELYWADLTSDSTLGDFWNWFRQLLWRNPMRCKVPQRLCLVWSLLWVMIGLGVLATANSLLDWFGWGWIDAFLRWPGWGWIAGWIAAFLGWSGWIAGLLAAVGLVSKGFLTATLGDVARYAFAAPRNIKPRREIRERGLKLLRSIAETKNYDRIIVVGHSLGTLVAHDLVLFAWTDAVKRLNDYLAQAGKVSKHKTALLRAIDECEQAGLKLIDAVDYSKVEYTGIQREYKPCKCRSPRQLPAERQEDLTAFRKAQRNLFRALANTAVGGGGGGEDDEAHPTHAFWLISDLITLGSPLTYAEFLIAQDLCELRHKTYSQEILRCPPITYGPGQSAEWGFSKNPCATDQDRVHEAAALAPVRWTNIYDAPDRNWFDRIRFWYGDLISGPIVRDFGPGVADIPVEIRRLPLLGCLPLTRRLFTHVWYWRDGRSTPAPGHNTTPEHLRLLRCALNFLDSDDNERALEQAAAAARRHQRPGV